MLGPEEHTYSVSAIFAGVPLKVAFRTAIEKRRNSGLSCVADERSSGQILCLDAAVRRWAEIRLSDARVANLDTRPVVGSLV
jgi:hypothetical protein